MEGAHRQSLLKLIKQLKGESLVGAEIGCHRGRTSSMLLKEEPRLKLLYLIDLWEPAAEDSDYWKSGDPCARRSLLECEEHYQETLKAVRPYGDRVRILRQDSVQAAESIHPLNTMNFVFLDAGHDEVSVAKDLVAWWPAVRPGGLVSGHDYHPPSGGHTDGVKRAVDRFGAEHDLFISTMPGNVWFTIKP